MQIVVDLKDKASKQLAGINKQFGKSSKSITKSVGAIGAGISSMALPAIAAVGGIGLAVGKSVSVFADFEKAIANAASVTGATGKAFEDTKKNIEEVSNILGKTTVHSASDAANAFYDLASAGYDVVNMTKSDLKPILDIASATQNELSYTTGVVTSTLGQFGLKIKDSERIADVFAKTIGSSKATLGDLEYSLKQVGPVANSMGLSIEDTNAILGNLYNAGFKGEQAGTALKNAFSRLLNPTTAMGNRLEEMGLTLDDVNPTTKDLAGILDTLTEAGMETNDAMALFGSEAGPAMLALTGTTPDIRKLERALYDAGGTAETMADQQLDTLSGSFALIRSIVEGVMISIGKEFAPLISRVAKIIVDLIPKIQSFASGIGADLLPKIISFAKKLKDDLQPGLTAVMDAVDSIIKILDNLYTEFSDSETAMSTMTSVVGGLVDAFNFLAKAGAAVFEFFADHPTLTKAVGAIAISVALITTPILAIIAAIGVLAVVWDQNWFGIKDTVVRIVDIIVTHVTDKLDLLAKEWDENGAIIMATVEFAWGLIKGTIENTMDLINTAINVVLDIIEGDWSSAWNRIVELTGRFKERYLEIFDDLGFKSVSGITSTMGDILSNITSGWGDILSTITNTISDIISEITSGWGDMFSVISTYLGDISSIITTGWSDIFSEISKTIDNILSAVDGGWGAVLSAIVTGMGNILSVIIGSWGNVLSETTTAMGNILSVVTGKWGNILSKISSAMSDIKTSVVNGWANVDKATGGSFGTILSTVKTSFNNIKSSIGSKLTEIKNVISGWFNGIKAFFDFSKHKIKWPRITNPFAGVNFCNFVPSNMKFLFEGCGGSAPHNKSAPHDKAHSKSHSKRAHNQSSYDRASCSMKDYSGYDRGAIKFQHGGPVKEDVNADIHKGEWVVPKHGALVMTDSKPSHVKISYSFGNVYGVNDLEKLLQKHDRDLYRKLESLV